MFATRSSNCLESRDWMTFAVAVVDASCLALPMIEAVTGVFITGVFITVVFIARLAAVGMRKSTPQHHE